MTTVLDGCTAATDRHLALIPVSPLLLNGTSESFSAQNARQVRPINWTSRLIHSLNRLIDCLFCTRQCSRCLAYKQSTLRHQPLKDLTFQWEEMGNTQNKQENYMVFCKVTILYYTREIRTCKAGLGGAKIARVEAAGWSICNFK